jgi:hypothetical protein
MKSIQLRNGLWLVGEGERLAVCRDKFKTDVLGHIVQGRGRQMANQRTH